MQYLTKVAITFLLIMILLPLGLFTCYDILAFQSRKSDMHALISRASPDEQNISPETASLIRISMHETAALSGQLLIDRLHVPWVSKGQFGWHITSILWQACTALHLSEQEQIKLIASLAYMGNGRYGFSAEALARFQKPLAALSLPETASLVVLMNNPSAYASSPERLERRSHWLLQQVQNPPLNKHISTY